MKIPYVDLKTQFHAIEPRVRARIDAVLEHGRYVNGPEVAELERALADYAGTRHALGCSSGTDALLLPLLALRVGPGDAVLTTPFTFFATAEVIALLGATPVFVDVEPDSFNVDPGAFERAIEALRERDPSRHPLPRGFESLTPRAAIPVDLFGLPADLDALQAICDRHGIAMIEDAAQSFGATLGGRRAGSFGAVAATSFFPAKPLGCYGDGGMVFTDDDEMIATLRSLRVHGQGEHKYDNVRIGLNARLDTIQAAVLLAKFERFPAELERRREVARAYATAIEKTVGSRAVLPRVPEDRTSAWAQFTIRVPERDRVQAALQADGIPTAVYYRPPLHAQPAFAGLGHAPEDFPVSLQASGEVLSLPFGPDLGSKVVEHVAERLAAALDSGS